LISRVWLESKASALAGVQTLVWQAEKKAQISNVPIITDLVDTLSTRHAVLI